MNVVMIESSELDALVEKFKSAVREEIAQALAEREEDKSLNYTQAGERIGVCRQTVAAMCRRGEIKLDRTGKIPASEIERVTRVSS